MRKLFLLTKGCEFSRLALDLTSHFFPEVIHLTHRDDYRLQDHLDTQDGLISFLYPQIISQDILSKPLFAINFHPGNANYPGIGCYNFALYENANEYGAICHHMVSEADAGPVIAEKCFKVLPSDTVASLKVRTMITMLEMYHQILLQLKVEGSLPQSDKKWTRKAFTRKDLNALGEIDLSMTSDEIQKRKRAMTYPGFPSLRIKHHGLDFLLKDELKDLEI